jgi:hypothetical protein
MKTLVIYPGRFQPFGKHHFGVYENLKKKFPDADIFIATSNIINKPKSPFGFDLKKEIIEQYGVPGNDIIKVKNPYKCEEIISRVDPTTTAIVFAYGSKDIDRLSTVKKDGSPGYFEIYADSAPLRPLNEKGYIIPVEHIDLLVGSKEMSGTTLRDYIKTASPEEFKEIMGWYDNDIYTEIKMELTENDKSCFFNLITEGGAGGHMKHPFDDRNLTFGEIKDMIEEFLSGDLNVVKEVSEKLDGQNLMVTYKDGEVKAARNKTTIITPMSMSELKTKFDGRGEIYDAFSSAMTDLTIALSSINKTQLEAIFNNGLNFINLEILYPPTKNVIDYGDQLVLVFHGITKFNELGNKVGEITSANSIIQQIVHDINADTETKFKFSAGNIPDLQRIPNFQKKTSDIISIVNKLQQDQSLTDSHTIGDYYRSFWDKFIDSQKLGLDPEMKNILVNRWANDDRSVKLTRNTFKNNLEVVKKLEANIVPKYNMKLYSNLEIIFLKVGTLVLENLTNVLSANPDKTVQFIKSELETIIANVRSSNDPAGLAKVNKYLKKLNVIGGANSIVPTEGLVFTYKGKRYKLTGTFSPVNQILGLYKFKR